MTETVETRTESPATTPEVAYFWYVSVSYQKKLDRPAVEIKAFPGGYSRQEREYETVTAFQAGTVLFPADKVVTRFELLMHSRTDAGNPVLFDKSHMSVTAFECGRNEL